MGIKWSEVKVGTSMLTNQIYIGKLKRDKNNPKLQYWTDKSGDKTNEVVMAVFEHMVKRMEEGHEGYTIDGYELLIRKLNESQEGEMSDRH